jgi:rod shape-determining protein MreD
MKGRTVLWIIIPLLVVAHFLLHVGLSLGRGAPDLLTLALLLAVREVGMGWGGGLGFFFGLLEDAFSVLAFGANTLALTIVGILGAGTRDFFVGDSLLFLFSYLSMGGFLRILIHWAVAGEAMRGPFLSSVLVDGGISALYMASVGTFIVVLLGGSRALR